MDVSRRAETGSTIIFSENKRNFAWSRAVDNAPFVDHPVVGGGVPTEVSGIGQDARGIIEFVLPIERSVPSPNAIS